MWEGSSGSRSCDRGIRVHLSFLEHARCLSSARLTQTRTRHPNTEDTQTWNLTFQRKRSAPALSSLSFGNNLELSPLWLLQSRDTLGHFRVKDDFEKCRAFNVKVEVKCVKQPGQVWVTGSQGHQIPFATAGEEAVLLFGPSLFIRCHWDVGFELCPLGGHRVLPHGVTHCSTPSSHPLKVLFTP